ncbi:HWE histidine kinase domain-containing protein [Rhizobium sp. PAMB 3174]
MSEHIDLANCDAEPIHLLGRVQSFGFLVALLPDWTISHVSENVRDFLPMDAQSLMEQPATQLLSAETIHAIRNRLQFLRPKKGVEVVYNVALEGVEDRFDVSLHIGEGRVILEFEKAGALEGVALDVANVRNAIDQLAEVPSLHAACSQAVRFVKMMTGFDRVMLYKFLDDGSGEVMAEARRYDMGTFLNLRYPATDIPRQARALYVENPIRLIADVSDAGAPILAAPIAAGSGPIDLSGSRLRSVSPIHIEYLKNMGVGASMSISVIVNGELWGLIACHHERPHTPTMRQRSAVLLFGQMLSLIIQTRLTAEERVNDARVTELTAQISKTMSTGVSAPELLKLSAESFAQLLKADGYAVIQEGVALTGGAAPDREDVFRLQTFLNTRKDNEVLATHELSSLMPEARAIAGVAAGILSVPISRSPHDYILFFRGELVQQVVWAGNPDKPAEIGADGARISPRKSFAAWQTSVHGQSAPWTSAEIRAASQLRVMLLEVVLRLTDEAGRERKLANEKQELLIAELNHRVRNILGLVRGLISQSSAGEDTTADFVKKLDSRVQALARAHDQITRQNWSPAPFSQLVRVEAESYLLDKRGRISIEGPELLLSPQAFSSVALVIHEMITNSAKHGALSDQRGRVTITLSHNELGDLDILWREIGGPPVKAPERRGFGSAIIERTIPFELGGKASISYNLEGVTASFLLPAQHIVAGETPVAEDPAESGRGGAVTAVAVPQSVLIVEDNLIIAMEAEDIFRTLGSRDTVVVSSVGLAVEELSQRTVPIDFALLDVNLGTETSFEVARMLKAKGIPFAFASGYGDTAAFPEEFAGIPMISKPYDRDTVLALLR